MAFYTENYYPYGSSSGTPVYGETLTFSGNVASTAHIPITNSVQLFIGGGLDTPVTDFMVAGNQITVSATLATEIAQGAVAIVYYSY
jgi:hypothetical protein